MEVYAWTPSHVEENPPLTGNDANSLIPTTRRRPVSRGEDVMMPTNTSRVARVNGIELGYQVVGEGEPLVLLHGGFGSVEMFGPNVELLAARRQVVGVDLQSHGRSPATDRPMRFETMADDIAALIRILGFERGDHGLLARWGGRVANGDPAPGRRDSVSSTAIRIGGRGSEPVPARGCWVRIAGPTQRRRVLRVPPT